MRPVESESGRIRGPYTVARDLSLTGMITGDATVAAGATFELRGMVTGNLTISEGASATIRGTVSGNLHNDGQMLLKGVVGGRISSGDHATTSIAPGASINGKRQ